MLSTYVFLLLLHRQIRISHQAFIYRPCGLAALADGPYHQGLAPVHIARRKYIRHIGLVAALAGGHVGAAVDLQAESIGHILLGP